jgi:hypothetical protein
LFDIGLPLIVQAASKEGQSRLLYYTDLISNALKSFKKIQFEAPLPAATITAIDSLNPSGQIQKIRMVHRIRMMTHTMTPVQACSSQACQLIIPIHNLQSYLRRI